MSEDSIVNLDMNQNNKSIMSSEELNALFSSVGVDTPLDKLGVYFYYRCVYVWIDFNYDMFNDYYFEEDLQEYATDLISKLGNRSLFSHKRIRVMWDCIDQNTLYNSIARIEPDVFFKSYFADFCSSFEPMKTLHNALILQGIDAFYDDELVLLYRLFILHENYPHECVFFVYQRLTASYQGSLIPDYSTFCMIWTRLFIISRINLIIRQYDINIVLKPIQMMGLNTAFKRSLIILYAVLCRDYRGCEKEGCFIEKLRDGNDPSHSFNSLQAIFTFQNPVQGKVRFLNSLFEATVPSGFKYSTPNNREEWKTGFTNILKFFGRFSLSFCLDFLIADAFPSTCSTISYLSLYPSREKHSTDRKIIEIICAYLYANESENPDRIAVFQSYLEDILQRDALVNYDEIYNHLEKLHHSYALAPYRGTRNYSRIINSARSVLSSSGKRQSEVLLKSYLTTGKKEIKAAEKLTEVPALDFLIENQINSCPVEDNLIFEETANLVLQEGLNSFVLLQPSYVFIMRWISDYRTKNRKTTIVLYDDTIVNMLSEKAYANTLVSPGLFALNQKTRYDIRFVTTVASITEFDLAITFHNKSLPRYEDIIALSRLLGGSSKMISVLPQKFFQSDAFENARGDILLSSAIQRVTYINSNLFAYQPKKKVIVEFCQKIKKDSCDEILLRFIEIDKTMQKSSGNLIKSDLGLYYIGLPTEGTLVFLKPYDGRSISFKEAYHEQHKSEKNRGQKDSRSKAKEIRLADDFVVHYSATTHGNSRQGKVYFAQYMKASKAARSKKDYGKKIQESQVTVTAADDDALEKKIMEDLLFSDKFLRLRNAAVNEIRSAYQSGVLSKITLFSFAFAYSSEIKQFYVNSFDPAFCYKRFAGTSLGSLFLNEATQEDFENAITELKEESTAVTIKMYDQLEKILDIAAKQAVLYDSRSPVFMYIAGRKKYLQKQAQLRDAFTTKTLTNNQMKREIEWLLERIPEEPVYLGTMIKLLTGMSSPEVCMLKWGDFHKVEGSSAYQLQVVKKMNHRAGKEIETKGLSSEYKYRLVPIPNLLSTVIQAHKKRYKRAFYISPKEGMANCPLVVPSFRGNIVVSKGKEMRVPDTCSVDWMMRRSKYAKEMGAGIPEKVMLYQEVNETEKYDLNRYVADFYVANFRYHALNEALMTRGEVDYMLGLAPIDTFSRHYCDYMNATIQKGLVDKLNDWCDIYTKGCAKPQYLSGTVQNTLKKTIHPVASDCASGQLWLTVKEDLQYDINIAIESDRGIGGTIIIYEE